MKKINIDHEAAMHLDGDNTTRPVSGWDCLTCLLIPAPALAFVDTDRSLLWLASILAIFPFLATLVIDPIYNDLMPSSLKAYLNPVKAYYGVFSFCSLVLIIIALVKTISAIKSTKQQAELPRAVQSGDYFLSVVNPPVAIALHRTQRLQWIAVGLLWSAGMASAFWMCLAYPDAWLVAMSRALVIHLSGIVMAIVSTLLADRTYAEMYLKQ